MAFAASKRQLRSRCTSRPVVWRQLKHIAVLKTPVSLARHVATCHGAEHSRRSARTSNRILRVIQHICSFRLLWLRSCIGIQPHTRQVRLQRIQSVGSIVVTSIVRCVACAVVAACLVHQANGRSTLAKQIILRVQNQHVTIRIANCLDRTCRHLREIH